MPITGRGYPGADRCAFAGLAAPELLTIADISAGTGISSRLMAEQARGAGGAERENVRNRRSHMSA
jgi:hypothetical protein